MALRGPRALELDGGGDQRAAPGGLYRDTQGGGRMIRACLPFPAPSAWLLLWLLQRDSRQTTDNDGEEDEEWQI